MTECQVLGNSMSWSLLSGAAASGPRKFDVMVLGISTLWLAIICSLEALRMPLFQKHSYRGRISESQYMGSSRCGNIDFKDLKTFGLGSVSAK